MPPSDKQIYCCSFNEHHFSPDEQDVGVCLNLEDSQKDIFLSKLKREQEHAA